MVNSVAWQPMKSLEFGAWQLVKSLDYKFLFALFAKFLLLNEIVGIHPISIDLA